MAWASTADKGLVVTAGSALAVLTNDSTHGTFTTGAWSVGDRVVVTLNGNGFSSANATYTASDSLGNTYNEDSGLANSTTERDSVLSGNVTTGGTPTFVKVTMSAGTAFMEMVWARYTGLLTTGGAAAAVDKSVVAFGASGAPASGNTAATTAANELVVGAYGDLGQNSSMAGKQGAGFTQRVTGATSADAQAYLEDKDSGATGVQASASQAIVGSWYMHCVVYQLAAAGAASTLPLLPPSTQVRFVR